MLRLSWGGVVCVVAVAVLVGCNSGHTSKGPKTAKVTGLVTLDGNPVGAGAIVVFAPKAARGTTAQSVTDASSKYKLDAVPDSYNVTVAKTETAEEGTKPMTQKEAMLLKMKEDREAKAKKGKSAAKDLLPAKYKSAATSGLTADVKDAPNDIPLKLESR